MKKTDFLILWLFILTIEKLKLAFDQKKPQEAIKRFNHAHFEKC